MLDFVGPAVFLLQVFPQLFETNLEDDQFPEGPPTTAVELWRLPAYWEFIMPHAVPQFESMAHVLLARSDKVSIHFRDAYIDDCSMIAVAGAIMAQVALTSFTLPFLSQTFWLTRACLIASIILGALSVYFAVMIQKMVGNLSTPADITTWLTRPLSRKIYHSLGELDKKLEVVEGIHNENAGERTAQLEPVNDNDEVLIDRIQKEPIFSLPSVQSAVLLVGPSVVLNGSLGFFLLGFGLYLGFLWKKDLDSQSSALDAWRLFTIYIGGTVIVLVGYYAAITLKGVETAKQCLRTKVIKRFKSFQENQSCKQKRKSETPFHIHEQGGALDSPNLELIAALESSVRAHEIALQANRELLAQIKRSASSNLDTVRNTT